MGGLFFSLSDDLNCKIKTTVDSLTLSSIDTDIQ